MPQAKWAPETSKVKFSWYGLRRIQIPNCVEVDGRGVTIHPNADHYFKNRCSSYLQARCLSLCHINNVNELKTNPTITRYYDCLFSR